MESHKVVIIGAGAGGAAAAWALTQQGIPVLLLEAGPWFSPERDYLLHHNHWERQRFPLKAGSQGKYSFGVLQPLEERWSGLRSWNIVSGRSNTSDRRRVSGPGYHHVRAVGGSTLHFTGEAHRLNPAAMQMQSRFGVAADWPVDYAELEPYYQEVEELIGVAGPGQQAFRWRHKAYPLPPHPLSTASELVRRECAKAGYTWTANSRAALSRAYDGRPACNYCANCNRGCPRRDKGSVDVTLLKKASDSGHLEVRTNCQVLGLTANANNSIENLRYSDAHGEVHTIQAETVVLAAGAIETPRLLLESAGQYAPRGIANESSQVGKNLMETVGWTSSGLTDIPLNSHQGLPADAICWDFNAPDSIPGVIGGCRFSISTAEVDLVGPINYAQRILPGWGKEHKAAMRRTFGKALSISAIGESLPNDGTFVDLDPETLDSNGVPLARIHSFLPDSELKRMTFMMETCRKMLKASHIKGLVEEFGSYDFFSSTHLFGTCRMGNDPADSVVNSIGRCHGCENLYITDASIFPSSGGGESPSLTIEALALRTARHIAKQSGPT